MNERQKQACVELVKRISHKGLPFHTVSAQENLAEFVREADAILTEPHSLPPAEESEADAPDYSDIGSIHESIKNINNTIGHLSGRLVDLSFELHESLKLLEQRVEKVDLYYDKRSDVLAIRIDGAFKVMDVLEKHSVGTGGCLNTIERLCSDLAIRVRTLETFMLQRETVEDTPEPLEAEVVESQSELSNNWEERARELADAVVRWHNNFPAFMGVHVENMLDKAGVIRLLQPSLGNPHIFHVLCSIEEMDASGELVGCHDEAHELSTWKNLPAAQRYVTSATFESSRKQNDATD